MSFSLSPKTGSTKAQRNKRLANLTRAGNKRIKKLERIENRQRRKANRLFSCPSCGRKFGSNPLCAACSVKALRTFS